MHLTKQIVVAKFPQATCRKIKGKILYEVSTGKKSGKKAQTVRAYSALQAWKFAARNIINQVW